MCPAFPSNCPRGHVAIVNGCPICTGTCKIWFFSVTDFLLVMYSLNHPFYTFLFYNYSHLRTRLVIVALLTTTQQTTTTQAQLTCAPVRCTAPCNKGIMLGADGCPACVCWRHRLYFFIGAWENLFGNKDSHCWCLPVDVRINLKLNVASKKYYQDNDKCDFINYLLLWVLAFIFHCETSNH